jgi:hypothetical protein
LSHAPAFENSHRRRQVKTIGQTLSPLGLNNKTLAPSAARYSGDSLRFVLILLPTRACIILRKRLLF